MSKTELKNFTPCIDSITEKYGLVTSAVFGAVWRYCQMGKGACYKAQCGIAEKLNMSRVTINKHLKILVDEGYLEIIGKSDAGSNYYKDTGKAGIEISVVGFDEGVKEIINPVNEIYYPVNEVYLKKQLRNNEEITPSDEEGVSIPPPPLVPEIIKKEVIEKPKEEEPPAIYSYPADVYNTVLRVSELWKLAPPKAKTSRYKYWIKSARELKEACGEFGLALLEEIYENWIERQYMVSGPASLVNTAAGLAGRKRGSAEHFPPVATQAISYSWNSDLTEEENLRLMREVIKRQTEKENDQDGENRK